MLSSWPAAKFLSAWVPLAAAATVADPKLRLADLFAFEIGGYLFPPVTLVLGALGVLAARPLARRSESQLSGRLFLLVSLIMTIVVELWVLENRPGALFAFVVAIGVGFSGYSLIEMFGEQIKARVAAMLGKTTDTQTPEEEQP
jgi:hypothetical protein